MPLTIRRGDVNDVAIVAEYNRRMAEETEGKRLDVSVLQDGVRAVLADTSKGVYYLACDGDDVVGQVMLTWEWSDWRNGWWWWLQSVYIRSDRRRRGVFQALFDHVLQQARAAGDVLGVRLYVEKDNHAAQATYRKLGMETMPYLMFDLSMK
jgi:ribosomal protein S18 acetylase RimI-like enzyme